MIKFDYRTHIIEKLKNIDLELETESNSELGFEIKSYKNLAYKLDDFEVLGLAVKIEMKYEAIFESYYYNSYKNNGYYLDQNDPYDNYTSDNYFDFYFKIRKYLFNNDHLIIDMTKYQVGVEENKSALIEKGLYINLSRYVDSKEAQTKVFQKVKSLLSTKRDEKNKYVIPDEESILIAFNSAKQELFRLADKHVKKQLESIGIIFS